MMAAEGRPTRPLSHSWPRYILAAFPVFAVPGQRAQDRFGRAV